MQGTGVGPGDMAALKTACSVSPTGLTLIGQMVTSYSVLFHVAISAMKDECGAESMARDHTRGQFGGFPGSSSGKEPTCTAEDAGDMGLIPGLVRSPGRRHSNPLLYSCQKNPMNRGAWQATIQRAGKSQTRPCN